ncbi:hypothetical protein DOY81_004430 [Sarcophaga bullata]|nr:hypothetical protein DOY81_004430 [Sarcophaga bullata]
MTKDDNDKTIDDIVFDFSPTKKTDSTLNLNISKETKSKRLKFDTDISTDCVALPNDDLGITDDKTQTSSVVILTPGTQDIIFVDDSCNEDGDIDTMDLMADVMKKDNTEMLENLKKYESKIINKQQHNKLETFQKPMANPECLHNIKQEKITQNLMEEIEKVNKIVPTNSSNKPINTEKPQNPLFSSENQNDETDDEDAMPKPFVIKQEPPDINKKLSIKERFNIECAECEKLINFLDNRLTDEQIQQHLDKCKHHNAENLRQNTPDGFWNPFILSFQADDPRNEELVDTHLKDRKK